ncbi:MAG: rod-determining factor RdfA [Haloferacaceae archaeon]
MGTDRNADRRPSKVERVIEAYGLDGFGEQLARRWTAPEDSDSLRDLADLTNETVLDAALREAGEDVLDGEVENLYALLTGDETTEGMRVQARNTLQSRGVDADRVLSDFVSHQSVYTYLTEVRGVSKDSTPDDRTESVLDSIQRLRGRLVAVVEGSLGSLRDADELRLGDFDVLVDAQVYCRDCGTQFEVVELIRRGGCDCGDDDSA